MGARNSLRIILQGTAPAARPVKKRRQTLVELGNPLAVIGSEPVAHRLRLRARGGLGDDSHLPRREELLGGSSAPHTALGPPSFSPASRRESSGQERARAAVSISSSPAALARAANDEGSHPRSRAAPAAFGRSRECAPSRRPPRGRGRSPRAAGSARAIRAEFGRGRREALRGDRTRGSGGAQETDEVTDASPPSLTPERSDGRLGERRRAWSFDRPRRPARSRDPVPAPLQPRQALASAPPSRPLLRVDPRPRDQDERDACSAAPSIVHDLALAALTLDSGRPRSRRAAPPVRWRSRAERTAPARREQRAARAEPDPCLVNAAAAAILPAPGGPEISNACAPCRARARQPLDERLPSGARRRPRSRARGGDRRGPPRRPRARRDRGPAPSAPRTPAARPRGGSTRRPRPRPAPPRLGAGSLRRRTNARRACPCRDRGPAMRARPEHRSVADGPLPQRPARGPCLTGPESAQRARAAAQAGAPRGGRPASAGPSDASRASRAPSRRAPPRLPPRPRRRAGAASAATEGGDPHGGGSRRWSNSTQSHPRVTCVRRGTHRIAAPPSPRLPDISPRWRPVVGRAAPARAPQPVHLAAASLGPGVEVRIARQGAPRFEGSASPGATSALMTRPPVPRARRARGRGRRRPRAPSLRRAIEVQLTRSGAADHSFERDPPSHPDQLPDPLAASSSPLPTQERARRAIVLRTLARSSWRRRSPRSSARASRSSNAAGQPAPRVGSERRRLQLVERAARCAQARPAREARSPQRQRCSSSGPRPRRAAR